MSCRYFSSPCLTFLIPASLSFAPSSVAITDQAFRLGLMADTQFSPAFCFQSDGYVIPTMGLPSLRMMASSPEAGAAGVAGAADVSDWRKRRSPPAALDRNPSAEHSGIPRWIRIGCATGFPSPWRGDPRSVQQHRGSRRRPRPLWRPFCAPELPPTIPPTIAPRMPLRTAPPPPLLWPSRPAPTSVRREQLLQESVTLPWSFLLFPPRFPIAFQVGHIPRLTTE